ncbi:GntR family transcriptional regulator [Agrobacterium sp. AGB01]|uniref:GntR family transcriptional regulator n=1 Tax=Agrobacterium sp. AGB01 TaxID=2769302 RepID=UPI00177B3FFB|nr:GntR family transcriptional regulator [Agrobacterium sp. AGB01]MBD9388544.1 GntR family transcriptional regulator [Agrobacterium sp. AGB01]
MVVRRTLAEQIVDHVRENIAQNIYQPGRKLTTQSLAEELNVSMTPVREALKTLAALGFVELVANRGAVVASLDEKEAAHLLTVYSRLDMLAGELAAEFATVEDIDLLRGIIEQMMNAVARNDQITYFHENQDFHSALARISANPVLIDMHSNLNARLYPTRFRGLQENSMVWKEVALEHHAIVDAIQARDGELAGRLLRLHFRGAWKSLDRSASDSENGSDLATPIRV